MEPWGTLQCKNLLLDCFHMMVTVFCTVESNLLIPPLIAYTPSTWNIEPTTQQRHQVAL